MDKIARVKESDMDALKLLIQLLAAGSRPSIEGVGRALDIPIEDAERLCMIVNEHKYAMFDYRGFMRPLEKCRDFDSSKSIIDIEKTLRRQIKNAEREIRRGRYDFRNAKLATPLSWIAIGIALGSLAISFFK